MSSSRRRAIARVVGQPLRAVDRLVDVRNDTAATAADLVAKEAQPTGHRAFGHDTALAARSAVPASCSITNPFWDGDYERRVIRGLGSKYHRRSARRLADER
jgi:hypothetical protein